VKVWKNAAVPFLHSHSRWPL